MKRRFGQFLLIIGLILLIVFFFHDEGQSPRPGLFLLGLAGTLFGLILIWRGRTPPEASERFRMVRKVMKKKK